MLDLGFIQLPWNQLLQLHLQGLQDLCVPKEKNINLYFTAFFILRYIKEEPKISSQKVSYKNRYLKLLPRTFPNSQHFLKAYSKKIKVPFLTRNVLTFQIFVTSQKFNLQLQMKNLWWFQRRQVIVEVIQLQNMGYSQGRHSK